MNYYKEIKTKLIKNENYAKIKDYSKERNKVQTYYEVGKILNDAGKHYGKDIIGQYAVKLQTEVGKKYNKRTLYRIKQFYMLFHNSKVSPLATHLSWSHYSELLSLTNINEIYYYINQCTLLHLSRNDLRKRIKNKEYERLDVTTKQKLINQEQPTIQEMIKNPIIIHSNQNNSKISEKDLQNIILENIPSFLEELGPKFAFVKNEYKIKLGDSYN